MTTLSTLMRALALALLMAGAVATSAIAVTDDDVDQKIATATTAADHEALAAYFREKADAAAASARKHETMTHAMGGGSRETWRNHCRSLVHAFKAQEKDYRALAAVQEKLAKEASK